MLTGQRAGEIAWLRGSEVTENEIALPAERVKNARAHRVSLIAPGRDILAAQMRREGRDLIFGRGDGGFADWSKSKGRLDKCIHEMTGAYLPQWTAARPAADLGDSHGRSRGRAACH